MAMLAPCKDCEDREVGCHAGCEKYLAYKKEREKLNKINAKTEIFLSYKKEKHLRLKNSKPFHNRRKCHKRMP